MTLNKFPQGDNTLNNVVYRIKQLYKDMGLAERKIANWLLKNHYRHYLYLYCSQSR